MIPEPHQWLEILVSLCILLISLSVHESAHAWSADRLGDPTARRMGRVSLNPLVHIDLFGTILFPLIGLVVGGVVFGWAKPVPVVSENLRDPRRSHALIAAAGPFSNLLIAGICLLFIRISAPVDPGTLTSSVWALILHAAGIGLILNTILAVFNLLPIPPLDGGWILSGLLPEPLARGLDSIRPYGFVILVVVLYSNFFNQLIRPVLAFVQGLAL